MADQNDSWHHKNFRQNVRTKIEEAIRQAGNPTAKTVPEMETHVFQKARSKEEYLSLVARILIHIKDSKKSQGMVPGQVGPGPGGVPGGPPNVQGSDPMTALRSLASQGGNTTLVGQGPPPHQMPGQIPGQLLVPGPPGGSMPNMGQPQQPGMPQNMPQGPGMIQTMGQPGMNPMVVQQTRFLSNVVPQMTPQQQAQQAQQQAQHQAQQQHQQQMQQQQMQQQHPHGPPMQRNLLNPQMQVQRMRQQVPQQMHAGPGSPMVQQPSPAGQFQQPNQGPQFQCHSPVPAGLQMQNQGPGSNQPIPSPVQPLQNPGSLSRAQMTASPLGYAPSPSSQIVPSPVGAFQNRTPAGVPSPGSTLNTPATQIAPTPSPSNRNMQDDHMYLEKLKQLQKFVDPLRRMIMRMDKDEDKKKEQSRLKGLLDILTDPSKRCTMDVLLKCEQVLERMDMKYKAVSLPNDVMVQQPQLTSAPGMVKPQEQNIFQPLLDAIEKQIRTPLINHTLQRTFGPVIAALCGPSPRVPSPPPKRRKQEEDPNEIADVLQGEIARLDQRFKVQMDPVQHNGSKTVHLICQLEDVNLPCVPPINITVPENYPDRPPKCHIDQEEYESTPFLQSIKSVFFSHISSMPQKTSISCFLDTWEMSVRQACAPKSRTIAAI